MCSIFYHVFEDSLDMLDIVSRMRLARLLDDSHHWEDVAQAFNQKELVDAQSSLASPASALLDVLEVSQQRLHPFSM